MLDDYIPIVGDGVVNELRMLGERLAGKRVVNVNSSRVGGGVAEILNRMVPLLLELGLDARWEVIQGTQDFLVLTKNLHNALHGTPCSFTPHDTETYNEVTKVRRFGSSNCSRRRTMRAGLERTDRTASATTFC